MRPFFAILIFLCSRFVSTCKASLILLLLRLALWQEPQQIQVQWAKQYCHAQQVQLIFDIVFAKADKVMYFQVCMNLYLKYKDAADFSKLSKAFWGTPLQERLGPVAASDGSIMQHHAASILEERSERSSIHIHPTSCAHRLFAFGPQCTHSGVDQLALSLWKAIPLTLP